MILDKLFHSVLYTPDRGYNYTLWIAVGSLVVSICTFINNFFQRYINKKSYKLSLFKERFDLWNEFQEKRNIINEINSIFIRYLPLNIYFIDEGKKELEDKGLEIEKLILCLKRISFSFPIKKFTVEYYIYFYINLYEEYNYFHNEFKRIEKINECLKFIKNLENMFAILSSKGKENILPTEDIKIANIPEHMNKISEEGINKFVSIFKQSNIYRIEYNINCINNKIIKYCYGDNYDKSELLSEINKEIDNILKSLPFLENYSKDNNIVKEINNFKIRSIKEINKIIKNKDKRFNRLNFNKDKFFNDVNKMMEKYLYIDD